MCGINLFVNYQSNSDEGIIKSMNHATRHRGPDAEKFVRYTFAENSIFIGNNRLKIVDPSDNANQPLISTNSRYCLSYNGELYNYKELKKALELKYSFETHSDSEVLFYHLIENGVKGISDLNGMFAFVFYDSKTNDLLIARDAHGIKPLYYAAQQNFFLASSEIKGILASKLVTKQLNETQIPHYLKYKYAKRPETFYKNIFELEPGHYIKIEKESFSIHKWNSKKENDGTENSDIKSTDKIKTLLFNAVEHQLKSDVENGIFLSGGVDSTLLLAISKELTGIGLPSFSISNHVKDNSFGTDDYIFAKKAAKQFKSEFHKYTIDSSILNRLEELCSVIDQPIGDSALLLNWFLSEKAASKVKVALSGAGADEWFAGYNRHQAFSFYLKNIANRKLILPIVKSTSNIIPDGFEHPWRKQARLWNKFSLEITNDPALTFDNFTSVSLPEKIKKTYIKNNANFSLQDALDKDRQDYLVSDILMLTDKTSMLHSLEVRVPYLDNDLTNYLNTLPAEYLLKNGKKWILKELLNNLGGEEYSIRRKEGFGIPIGQWIKEPANIHLVDHLLQKKNILYRYVPFNAIEQILMEHLKNKKDHASFIWSVILLSFWLEKEFL